MMQTGLQNIVVLITGANHGIGAETAKAFTKEGASILINYLRLPPMHSYSQSEQI
jgi:3-oxoacyl-[acyl-carrier protein] reductase